MEVIASLHNTAFFLLCPNAPLIAVGRTTRRLVPKTARIAIFGFIPIDVYTQY
ncbi:hypothetical protein [Methanofervidicoccus abyssi]|uniref:hypothetical protein n=1 Tax=Methanofervidicoccus abyssi TaxID=2082189 RepID=UPI00129BEF07|nr:hypothetical protein [Methanofervidicoccus abyssi]